MMQALEDERNADLLVRYWGLGEPLKEVEREALLASLDEENRALNGPLHTRALERLKDRGIT
jgi:hypothetical protein